MFLGFLIYFNSYGFNNMNGLIFYFLQIIIGKRDDIKIPKVARIEWMSKNEFSPFSATHQTPKMKPNNHEHFWSLRLFFSPSLDQYSTRKNSQIPWKIDGGRRWLLERIRVLFLVKWENKYKPCKIEEGGVKFGPYSCNIMKFLIFKTLSQNI